MDLGLRRNPRPESERPCVGVQIRVVIEYSRTDIVVSVLALC